MSKLKIKLGSRWRRKDDHSRWARIDFFFENRLGYKTNLVNQFWSDIDKFLEIYELSPRQPSSTKKAAFLNERHIWLLNYIAHENGGYVDVLNSELVDSYVTRFNMAFKGMNYGANKCPQLGKDLLQLHNHGLLDRSTIGISSLNEDGWPKWVYIYRFSKARTEA